MRGALDEVDDRELVRRHVAGDPDAFGELFTRHRDRMWAVALSVCRDPETAADAVQDGFLSAFRRADGYRGDAAVTTWLHRVVVNACLDRMRRACPADSLDELTERGAVSVPSRPDGTAEVDTRLLVEDALATLPQPQRLVLVLVDMHGVPVAEAARMLGVAEGTVKSRGSRGRAMLAAILRAGTTEPARASDDEGGEAPPGRTGPTTTTGGEA